MAHLGSRFPDPSIILGRHAMRALLLRRAPDTPPWVERLMDSLCRYHVHHARGILYDWDELARRSCIQPERIPEGLEAIEKAGMLRLYASGEAHPRIKLLKPRDGSNIQAYHLRLPTP